MLRNIRHLLSITAIFAAMTGMAHAIPTAASLAPDAEKRCFANTITPEIYKTVRKRVVVHPGFERVRHIPAIVEQGNVRVMVKDAHEAYQTSVPTYTLKYEDILVEPSRQIVVKTPAKYETWTETIEISPAKLVWTRCKGLYGHDVSGSSANAAEHGTSQLAEIMCRTAIPAKKRIVHHTRMVSPPRREVKTIPARYKRVARQVIERPATSRTVMRSAEFATIPYEKQLIAARAEVEHVPATYADKDQAVLVAASAVVQAEVLCDQFASRETVRLLQVALVDRGYKIKVDGIYGPETQGAMEQFQRENDLSRGYMTLESIEALAVSPTPCPGSSCGDQRPQRTIIAAQAALSDAGYFAAQDGIHGPQTQASLEQFQAAHGLEIGFLSSETMNKLNIIARI